MYLFSFSFFFFLVYELQISSYTVCACFRAGVSAFQVRALQYSIRARPDSVRARRSAVCARLISVRTHGHNARARLTSVRAHCDGVRARQNTVRALINAFAPECSRKTTAACAQGTISPRPFAINSVQSPCTWACNCACGCLPGTSWVRTKLTSFNHVVG